MIHPRLTEETRYLQESYFLMEGSELYLPCAALGQPPPEVYWLKNMQKIPMQNLDENALNIAKLSPNDAGIYTCVARNELAKVAKNVTVKVLESNNNKPINQEPKPVVPIMPDNNLIMPNDPENTTVEIGQVATLQCKAQVCYNTFIMYVFYM